MPKTFTRILKAQHPRNSLCNTDLARVEGGIPLLNKPPSSGAVPGTESCLKEQIPD